MSFVRESQGLIVPFEAEGQHNPSRGKGPYFVHVTEGRRIRGLPCCCLHLLDRIWRRHDLKGKLHPVRCCTRCAWVRFKLMGNLKLPRRSGSLLPSSWPIPCLPGSA
jgi:hypothetical protein